MLFEVEKDSPRHGGELVAEVLKVTLLLYTSVSLCMDIVAIYLYLSDCYSTSRAIRQIIRSLAAVCLSVLFGLDLDLLT